MDTRFVCGTRKVLPRPNGTWVVVCATCDAGGTVAYKTKELAMQVCVRDSNRSCRTCGAH